MYQPRPRVYIALAPWPPLLDCKRCPILFQPCQQEPQERHGIGELRFPRNHDAASSSVTFVQQIGRYGLVRYKSRLGISPQAPRFRCVTNMDVLALAYRFCLERHSAQGYQNQVSEPAKSNNPSPPLGSWSGGSQRPHIPAFQVRSRTQSWQSHQMPAQTQNPKVQMRYVHIHSHLARPHLKTAQDLFPAKATAHHCFELMH